MQAHCNAGEVGRGGGCICLHIATFKLELEKNLLLIDLGPRAVCD